MTALEVETDVIGVSKNLVDLLDGGTIVTTSTGGRATGTREAARATGHATRSTLTTSSVELHHDGVGLALELLLVLLVLLTSSLLVVVEPLNDTVNLSSEGLLVGSLNLLLDLRVRESVAERVGVRLKTVLGSDTLALGLVLLLVLLSIVKHALNLLLRQAALVVGDDNLVGLAGTLLDGGDVHDTVGIKIEGDLNLGNTTGSRGDTSELELAHEVVVLGALTLTLVDLDKHTRLVVGEGREDLRLLGGDGSVSGDELGHHTTSGLNTERERGDIQEEDLVGGLARGVTRENGSLDSGTVGNSLIGVDGLVGLLSVEVVGDELLDTGDTGRSTDEDDLVDKGLVDLGVGKDTVDGLDSGSEEILAELLETGTGDGGVEVNTLEERVDLNGGLSGRRKSSLGTLASGSETSESTDVGAKILLVLALELVDEVVDQTVVEVLTTQVSVTGSGLDLEDTLLNGEERDIEGTTTKIEDQDVALALNLLVETVGNGGSGRLVDDSENVETGDETGILGSLTLRVVEVGRNGDNGVVDSLAEVRLSSLTHLGEDHGGDLLGSEGLLLTLELNLDVGLAALVDDCEGEVLHVGLDLSIGKLATDQSLGVEDGVLGVHGDLVLGGITNQTLGVGETDE
uniref:NAD-specific glutamate dehydrogenase n=1 Tax=Aureoumbra lagunensis TaxID=44058 RepID=A0A7S3NEG7_9STRA|mmetsp:Transcript_7213/g.10750  ORF Transcript_7213/g.10750 Transcript_7213/m.10750 type:complete len:630 (+) Transcript_7213:136-2025(+)